MEETKSIIHDYLRILTPDEMDALSTHSESDVQVPLIDIMNKKFEEFEISKREKEPDVKEEEEEEESVEKKDDGVEGMEVEKELSERNKKLEIARKDTQDKDKYYEEEKARLQRIKDKEEEEKEAEVEEEDEGEKKDTDFLFKRKKVKKEEKINITKFILEEKEKLKDCERKLKGAQIIKLYKKTSEVDIEKEKKSKGDLSQSSNLGLLINKKQG